ncbi:H/ACA ribonucleoprotein complex subunit 2-like protein [Macrobrachium nipponense]|uniref:H/ACA ribonucleoprotein complex subunit 2-like protein n=1 Tax=Macrobrachium nipponense TaxID=159736 RepID=UPI0030C7C73F
MGKIKTENPSDYSEVKVKTENEFDAKLVIKTEADEVKLEDLNGEDVELTYEQKLNFVSAISQPMSSKKTAGRIFKLIRKANQHKTPQQKPCLYIGLKNVQTRIRKGDKGIVIFAGDVSPVDLICHLPGVCEEKGLPYIYVPSRRDIGSAMGKKGGSLVVLILHHSEYDESYNKVTEDIKKSSKAYEI